MITVYKYLAYGIGLLALFALGALYGHSTAKPLTIETVRTVTVQAEAKVVEKIVYVDRIVTKTVTTTKKPDGTVVTQEIDKTEDKDKTADIAKDTKTLTASTEKTVEQVADRQKNYMVGYYKGLRVNLGVQGGQEVLIGRRLVGDLWINAGFSNIQVQGQPQRNEGIIGFSYQW